MKRILVAEDNLANRELLREILEARQYAVVKAMPEERHSPR
jgi:CheY-like chemotaxis protein